MSTHEDIWQAAKNGNISRLLEITCSATTNIDARNEDGITALHSAARFGQFAAVHTLIEAKAKIDVEDYENKAPLHHAAECGHSAVVQALIDAQATVDVRDRGFSR